MHYAHRFMHYACVHVCVCMCACMYVCMYTCCHSCMHAHAYMFRVKALGFRLSYRIIPHAQCKTHANVHAMLACSMRIHLFVHAHMYVCPCYKQTHPEMMNLVHFLFSFDFQNSMRVCRDEWVHCRRSAAPCAPRLSAFSPRKKWALPGGAAKFVALFVACILPTVNMQRPKRIRVCLSHVCFGLSRQTYTCPFMYYGNET
jgi:hypothetical protein